MKSPENPHGSRLSRGSGKGRCLIPISLQTEPTLAFLLFVVYLLYSLDRLSQHGASLARCSRTISVGWVILLWTAVAANCEIGRLVLRSLSKPNTIVIHRLRLTLLWRWPTIDRTVVGACRISDVAGPFTRSARARSHRLVRPLVARCIVAGVGVPARCARAILRYWRVPTTVWWRTPAALRWLLLLLLLLLIPCT